MQIPPYHITHKAISSLTPYTILGALSSATSDGTLRVTPSSTPQNRPHQTDHAACITPPSSHTSLEWAIPTQTVPTLPGCPSNNYTHETIQPRQSNIHDNFDPLHTSGTQASFCEDNKGKASTISLSFVQSEKIAYLDVLYTEDFA